MRLRTVSGFGLLQVMIGTVVLGIFAMVFVRRVHNRADVSYIMELATYRDQILDYYTALLQSRTAWQCTVKCNSSLHQWVKEGVSSSCPLNTPCALAVYDGDGNCQPDVCPAIKTLRLPSAGWRFALEPSLGGAYNFDPPNNPIGGAFVARPMLVEATWAEALASPVGNSVKVTISVDWLPDLDYREKYTAFNVGKRERVLYLNRAPYKNCADGLAARFPISGKHFYDDQGTGSGVARYAGDTAIVGIDPTTGLVTCWQSPLVIPPCYDPSNPPFNTVRASDRDSVTILDFVASQACRSDGSDKGLCPKVGLGTTGITHFDKRTGIAHCGVQHILIKNHNNDIDCGATNNGGLVGINDQGQYICSNDTGVGGGTGVAHNETGDCPYGIKGWDRYGNIECANDSQVTRDFAVNNIAFHDGYWVGDKGDTGCTGDKIRSCNCCEYPQHCTDSWSGCATTCEDINNDDLNLANEFKGCTLRTCSSCSQLNTCNSSCNDCLYGSISNNGERTGGRRTQYKPCRDYRDCLSNCSTCKSDQSKCSTKRSALSSCETDEDADCSSEQTDLDNCLDSACSTECNCSDPGSCGTLPNCSLACIIPHDPDNTDNDRNNCRNKPSPLHSLFGTRYLGTTCDACIEYNDDCSKAETESKKYKRERPTKVSNPTAGCSGSIYSNPSARMSCP